MKGVRDMIRRRGLRWATGLICGIGMAIMGADMAPYSVNNSDGVKGLFLIEKK